MYSQGFHCVDVVQRPGVGSQGDEGELLIRELDAFPVARATSRSNSRRCFAVSPTPIRCRPMPHWTHVRHLDSMTTAVH